MPGQLALLIKGRWAPPLRRLPFAPANIYVRLVLEADGLLSSFEEVSMTVAEDLATFVVQASYEDLSEIARQQLKLRILDSLGCAIGALAGEPIQLLRQHIEDFGGQGHCTLIGGGRTAPDRAALYNSALVRYLDFNDSYLAKGETGHPSDNVGAVLAAAQNEEGAAASRRYGGRSTR